MLDGSVGTVGAARLRLTDEQTTKAPDAARPDIGEAVGPQWRLGATPVPLLTVGAKAYAIGLGPFAKVMPLQPLLEDTPFSLALTIGYAEGQQSSDYDRTSDTPGAHTHVRQRLVDGVAWNVARWGRLVAEVSRADVRAPAAIVMPAKAVIQFFLPARKGPEAGEPHSANAFAISSCSAPMSRALCGTDGFRRRSRMPGGGRRGHWQYPCR